MKGNTTKSSKIIGIKVKTAEIKEKQGQAGFNTGEREERRKKQIS